MTIDLFSGFDPSDRLELSSNSLPLIFGVIVSVVTIYRPQNFWLLKPNSWNLKSFFTQFYSKSILGIRNRIGSLFGVVHHVFYTIFMMGVSSNLLHIFNPCSQFFFSFFFSFSFFGAGIFFYLGQGFLSFLKMLVPKGTPIPLISFMVLVEYLRILIRCLTLAIRLSANIVAGHILSEIIIDNLSTHELVGVGIFLPAVFAIALAEFSVSLVQGAVFAILTWLHIKG